MIRFMPDTWRDALLRPLSLAAPDGGVYVEIIAPDFRFLFAVVLALACLLLAPRGVPHKKPTLALLGITAAAFVPWLLTTGNGRYFLTFLLVVGPLCVALAHLLPTTKSFRLTLAFAMVFWQAYLVYEISPWRTWGHVVWDAGPPFGVEVPPEIAGQPATYISLSSISYSLIAPRFHPGSRWVNISTRPGVLDQSADGRRTQALIAAPGLLRVIFPTVPGGQKGDQIDVDLARAINGLLARQELSIDSTGQCRLLPSSGMAGMASSRLADGDSATPNLHGFWLCPLVRRADPSVFQEVAVPTASEEVFAKLESLCPRIFRPGETGSLRIPAGAVRGYPGSDFKLYVLDDGRVWYKYFRALNPVLLGDVSDVLAGTFTMDCDRIRGRSGLPWERDI